MIKNLISSALALFLLILTPKLSAIELSLPVHKMLLMSGEQHLFASHIPQWESPFNFQSFIEITFDDPKVNKKIKKKLAKSKRYYRLEPINLNVTDLKKGLPFDIAVKIYEPLEDKETKAPIIETQATMRALFYRQMQKTERKNNYSKYEKYYSVRSGKVTYLFNRITPQRPFDHIVVADNKCEDYLESLEVEVFKSKPQPSFSGSLESLKEIAKKNQLSNLNTIYFKKKYVK